MFLPLQLDDTVTTSSESEAKPDIEEAELVKSTSTIREQDDQLEDSSSEEADIVFLPIGLQQDELNQYDSTSKDSVSQTVGLNVIEPITDSSAEAQLSNIDEGPEIEQPLALIEESPSENTPLQTPVRPRRTRKPVQRFKYDFLGQTKQHIATQDQVKQDLYNQMLRKGKELWTKFRSPAMAQTRKNIAIRFLQETLKD